MESSDFFEEVAKQLQGGQWSRLDILDQNHQAYREQPSFASFNNMSVSGEFLKRKPLKQRGRMTESFLCQTQVIPKLSEAPTKTICLDLQLNRLEKTLSHTKNNPTRPRFKRQKTLLKRLETNNKQNNDDRHVFAQDNVAITSQFLQSIKRIDEELYEICLNLYRFREREQEESDQIKRKINKQEKQIVQKTIQITQLKLQLSQIRGKIEKQQQNHQISQLDIWKNSIRKYLSEFPSL